MLESLTIENFKRFRRIEFPRLKRVNLITGKNNTGKTGILEALLVLLDPVNGVGRLPTAFRNSGNLGDPLQNFSKWLFHELDTGNPIRFTATIGKESGPFSMALTLGPPPEGYGSRGGSHGVMCSVAKLRRVTTGTVHAKQDLELGVVALSVRPTDPEKDAADYDRVVLKTGGEDRLESLLRKIEPNLKTIRSIRPHGATLLYLDLGLKEKIPAVHLGQGFVRLLSIYSELIASGKKVLLIDEVENGLHYSVLTEIWRGLLLAAEQEDVQIFATTHSYECIRAAHQAFAETLTYDFALHRLEEVKGDIRVTTYDKETLETSLASNFEIR